VDVKNFPLALRMLRTPVLGWLSLKITSASFRTELMLKRAYCDESKVTDRLIEMYARYQRLPGSDHSLLKTAEQIVPVDYPRLKEALAKLEIPVINIWGEHDKAISRLSAEGLCRLLPRCAFVTLEDVGHVPQEERPEKVIALLREFLQAD
jgi:pimeloyl-ACP methyl ester carboxylesterase